MELNFLGAEQNLSVLAGSQPEYDVRFIGDDGEPVDLSDVTFDGVVTLTDESTEMIDVAQDFSDTSMLHLVFPSLSEVNSYPWELRAVSDEGEKLRIAHGKIGVLPTSLELEPDAYNSTEVKNLEVHLPGKAKAHAMMVWRASSRASAAAERASLSEAAAKAAAQQAADSAASAAADAAKVATAAENAKQIAEDATAELKKSLEDLKTDTERLNRDAEATVKKLQVFMVEFTDNVRSVIYVDPETEHLIIGGVDTLCKVTGEPGKSPYVDKNGDWQYWDDETKQWMNGGPARGEAGFSPYVNAEGYLVYRDPLTGEVRTSPDKMYGQDGLDGTQVRRIIVQGEEDLPREGETCNGGCYYYIPLRDAPPVAIFSPSEERTTRGAVMVNRRTVELPSTELGAAEAAEAFAESLRAVFPEAVVELDPENNAVILIADVPYWQVQNLPEDEWQLTLHVRMKRDGYDVFAWCEKDGSANWVRVGEANDLATAELYGLTKLGTGATIERGAPVGTDARGAMRVPAADVTQQGTVQLSVAGRLEDGVGGIGVDESGKIWARRASASTYGVSKPSYTGSLETAPVVGIDEQGSLRVPFATLNQAGVIKLGSRFAQSNPIPYQVGIGATQEHNLSNNLIFGGAYKHMEPRGWRALALPWLDALIDENPNFFGDMYYSGLHSSLQFTQSANNGLELLSATTTLKAGVYIAIDIPSENREDAVPTSKTVRDWVHDECYTKTQADEKERALSERINANASKFSEYTNTEDMHHYVEQTLLPYATQAWVNNALKRYYTKKESDARFVRGEDGILRIGLYKDGDDPSALSTQNPDKLYIKSQKKVI